MDIMKLLPEELGKGSPIRLERCGSEHDIYWKMALEMLDLIQENNAKGKTTFMIVPYGPLGGYSVLVYLIIWSFPLKITFLAKDLLFVVV